MSKIVFVAVQSFVLTSLLTQSLGAPAESNGPPAGVTRDDSKKLPKTGFPDFISNNVRFSTIDINAVADNQLAFALKQFPISQSAACTPKATIARIEDALKVYLADEFEVRKSADRTVAATLPRVKGVKFFLQFQMARVAFTADAKNDDVEHQRGKVSKNAGRAAAADFQTLAGFPKTIPRVCADRPPAPVNEPTGPPAGVTRDNSKKLPKTGFPDFISNNVRYSTIDINAVTDNQLAFALKQFPIDQNAACTPQATIARIEDALKVYLADEFEVRRSTDPAVSATLQRVKGVKFFLQFQKARIAFTADATNDDVEHQRGKVSKNAARAAAADFQTLAAFLKNVPRAC